MNFSQFIGKIGRGCGLVIEHALWPATKAIFGLLWETLCSILRPSAKSAGEGMAKLVPFFLVVGVVAGGLYGLLHAPQHLQEQGVALVALLVFCMMMWAALKPSSKKKVEPPPRRKRKGCR